MEISYGRVVLFAADLLPPWIQWREVWIIVIVVSNRGWMNGLIMLSCFCCDLWSCYCYYMNQYPQLSSTEISHYVACLAANSTAWEFGLSTMFTIVFRNGRVYAWCRTWAILVFFNMCQYSWFPCSFGDYCWEICPLLCIVPFHPRVEYSLVVLYPGSCFVWISYIHIPTCSISV